jgi:hypothetical protein
MGNVAGAAVTALENSPALDTMAVGLANGGDPVPVKSSLTHRLKPPGANPAP